MNAEPTVYVVDDDPGVREGLSILVRSAGRLVETFAEAAAFLAACQQTWTGCIVLDVRMPGMSGLEVQEQLRACGVLLPVIVITGFGDVPAAVRAMKAGAVDFIEKPFCDQVLLDRIEHAICLEAQSRRERAAANSWAGRLARLTPREHEVLDELVAGKSIKQIAAAFGVSFQAAAAHRSRIMDKLEVDGLAELVRQMLAAETSPWQSVAARVEEFN
ncbi:MAG: response regulator [Planctomycetes bacterium]|nr:response regulator [Planctomycetota bacterium]